MASSISKNHSNLKPHSLWNEGLPAIQQKATKETKRGLPLRSLRLLLFKTSQHDRLSLLSNVPAHRPRASDASHATETHSRGSVQPVCSALIVSWNKRNAPLLPAICDSAVHLGYRCTVGLPAK